MNNKEYIAELSRRTGYSQDNTQLMVRCITEQMALRFDEGESVTAERFGTFEPQKRMERIVVSPANGQRIMVPPKIVLTFNDTPDDNANANVESLAMELKAKYGLEAKEAREFANNMFEVVATELKAGEKSVKIKGLGTFRLANNGNAKMTFTPELALRDRVNRPFAQFETVAVNDGVDFSEIDRECSQTEPDTMEETAPDSDTMEKTDPDSMGETDSDSDSMDEDNENEDEPEEDTLTEENGGEQPQAEAATETSEEQPQTESAVETSEEQPQVVAMPVCKQRNPRLMYWLTAASFCLLIAIGVGMYVIYQRIEAKNAALEQLQNRLAERKPITITPKPHKPIKPQPVAEEKAKAKPAPAKEVKTQNDTVAKVKPTAKPDAKPKPDVNPKAKPDKVAKPLEKTAKPDYSRDVRIRTGGYTIVGTDFTVTVRPGQTLASISRAHLGPGMECYVEAINNRTTVKPGDKLKIPKLKLKKK